MNENNNSDINVSTEETKVEETEVVETDESSKEPLQSDPVQVELEKIQKKGKGRSELEKAIFTKNQIEKRIAELKGETNQDEVPESDEDDAPVTVGMLKKIQKQQNARTALAIAEEQITDDKELELVKYHLQNTIKPSGSATEDLRIARSIVNSVKNKIIIDEMSRKSPAKRTSSGGSSPGKHDDYFEPTAEELKMMSFKGFDGKPLLTKEDILKSRRQ